MEGEPTKFWVEPALIKLGIILKQLLDSAFK